MSEIVLVCIKIPHSKRAILFYLLLFFLFFLGGGERLYVISAQLGLCLRSVIFGRILCLRFGCLVVGGLVYFWGEGA